MGERDGGEGLGAEGVDSSRGVCWGPGGWSIALIPNPQAPTHRHTHHLDKLTQNQVGHFY